jgi:Spy/CpxP family protein refolding chaperone
MRTMFRGMVGLGLAAILAAPAMAQGQGRGFGGMMGGGGISMLIGNASVQKEIKLDDAQTDKAKELVAKNREKMTELREKLQGVEQDERRTKMTEFNKELNASTLKAIGEFLKPEQITRLHQISYQTSGANAFTEEAVIKKLSITDSQKDEIKTIVDDSRAEMREIFSQIQDDREAGMKKLAEHRKETLAKVVAKLNDEQQKTWKEMTGDPFEVKFEPRPNN